MAAAAERRPALLYWLRRSKAERGREKGDTLAVAVKEGSAGRKRKGGLATGAV